MTEDEWNKAVAKALADYKAETHLTGSWMSLALFVLAAVFATVAMWKYWS